MRKLAAFANTVKKIGASHAMAKVANPMAAGQLGAEAGMLSKLLPKTRLGRLGALGALGAGALAMGNRKEETMLDKANNYINNIDPATINAAMGLYGQLSNPQHMGYSSDPTMGVDFAEHSGAGLDDEYLDDMEKGASLKTANSKLINYLKGALAGIGGASATSGMAKGLRGLYSDPEAMQGLFYKGLGNLDEMGLAGIGLGGGIGASAAGLAMANRAAKAKGKDLAETIAKSGNKEVSDIVKSVRPPRVNNHEAAYAANYQRAFAPNNPYYMY